GLRAGPTQPLSAQKAGNRLMQCYNRPSNLPASLRPLAVTADADRELMALRHVTLPLYGVQFHPEALLTLHGRRWLANWMACCNIA
ncbi:MAG: aminodeoxychorismate/anthranilate synthase component II, partial [Hymenobacter sp.]